MQNIQTYYYLDRGIRLVDCLAEYGSLSCGSGADGERYAP